MQRYTSLSLAVILVACGSRVDLGDANQHVSGKSKATGGGTSVESDGSTTGTGGDVSSASGAGGSPGATAGGSPGVAAGGSPGTPAGGSPGETGGTSGGVVTSSGGAPTAANAGPTGFAESSPSCDPISLVPGVFNPCGRTTSIAFSPDGKLLATATEDQPSGLHLWRLSDGKRVRDFAGANELDALSMDFSPDGKLLAVAGYGATVALYDASSGAQVRQIPVSCGEYASAVAFSEDGALLATGGASGPVEVWRVSDGTLVTSIMQANTVDHLTFVKSQLLVGCGNERATLWNIPDDTQVWSLSPIGDEESAVQISPDGRQVISTGNDPSPGGGQHDTIKLWDVASGSTIQTLLGHQSFVSNVIWIDQDHVVSNDWSGLIIRWARQSNGLFAAATQWQTPHQSLGIAVSPDRHRLVAGTGVTATIDDNNRQQGFVFLAL